MPTMPFVAIHSAVPAPLPHELAYAPPRNTTTAGTGSDRGVAGSTTLIDGRGRSGQSGTSNAWFTAGSYPAGRRLRFAEASFVQTSSNGGHQPSMLASELGERPSAASHLASGPGPADRSLPRRRSRRLAGSAARHRQNGLCSRATVGRGWL